MALLHRLSQPGNGTLEVLKLVAMAAMVADHANKYGLNHAYPAMEHVGRLAFPLFALVVAANLRWNTSDPQRYFVRLAVWGVGSQAVYAWATGRVELNILLTLAVGVQLVLAVEALRRRYSAAGMLWLLVVVGASLACDYRMTGPLLVLLFHVWFARPGRDTALLVVVGVAAVNASLVFAPAALASLVLAVAVTWWAPRVPRVTRHWFYPFYPAHLALIRWLG